MISSCSCSCSIAERFLTGWLAFADFNVAPADFKVGFVTPPPGAFDCALDVCTSETGSPVEKIYISCLNVPI